MSNISSVSLRRNICPTIVLSFHPKATMPARLEDQASRLGISAEQLIHRFISEGMRQQCSNDKQSPSALGTSMQDVLVRNGVLAA
tara:strand:- start:5187 stop:5441 length:255 start_codon:yes stop_codon:yes gene_type:complete